MALRLCRAELGRGAEWPRGDDSRPPHDRCRPGILRRGIQPHPPAGLARRPRRRPEPGRRSQAPVDDARVVVGLRHRHQVRSVRSRLHQGRHEAREDDAAEYRPDVRSHDRHKSPQGFHGSRDAGGARADVEAAQGHPHHRDGRWRAVALRGVAGRLARHQGARGPGRRIHGREGHAARNRDSRVPRRDRDGRLSHHDAHRGERDLRPGKEPGDPVVPGLLTGVHQGAHAGRRVRRQRQSQAGRHRHELSGPGGNGHGRSRGGASPRQQEPHRRSLRSAEESGVEGAVPGGRSGAPADDEHRPLHLPRVPPRPEPDAVRQGADRRQRHVDGAQDKP